MSAARPVPPRLGAPRPEQGTGLIGTASGVAVFLALLSVAMQVLLQLRTTSTVRAAAYEAARRVATADEPVDGPLLAGAEARGRAVLGGLAEGATFRWDTSDPATVRLTVTAPAPDLLVPAVAGPLGAGELEGTVAVRREAVRPG